MSSDQVAGAIGTPASEIDASLILSFLTAQHPELAHLPLHPVGIS